MKTTKTMLTALMVAVLWLAGGARAAEIRNVTATYAWPWGVEICFELVGTVSENFSVGIEAKDVKLNRTYWASSSALYGDTGPNEGMHRVIWNLDKQGIKLQSTNVVITVLDNNAIW